MSKILLFTLLVGVANAGVVFADQSQTNADDDQPIGAFEDNAGRRRVETPEVVLQLKYSKGELNRIYLAQFRKQQSLWEPSVPARTDLCADLCHAGLGGTACGSTCMDLTPVGLQTALKTNHSTEVTHGSPRVDVCPALCKNHLGEPLCNCSDTVSSDPDPAHADWSAVCAAFCTTEQYVLHGCPSCEELSAAGVSASASRILNTVDGWTAWCDVQCRQGQGGAACNCERSLLQ